MNKWIQKLLPGKKLEDIHDLQGWRIYYIRLMILLGVIAFPIGLFFSLPTYIAENAFGLILFDIAVFLTLIFILLFVEKNKLNLIFFLMLYGMALTFIVTLGPYYARPAWLIMCVVSAAFLFGVRAVIFTTLLNVLILLTLYFYAAPFLPAWSTPHSEPLSKWLMFCANLSLLSLMAGIPVGFLLNRIDSLLQQEKNMSRQLTSESENLQHINAQLENEITERSKAEAENKRLEAELIQAQKMEALGTLAGGIAHDFNNILSAIIGYAQLIQIDPSVSAKSRQNVEKLLKSGDRARMLVQQILAFSRKVDTAIEPLDVAQTVSETLKMLRALIPANIELTTNFSGPCMALSSATFIHQILMNLCGNAISAMGAKGGPLAISVAGVTLADQQAKELGLSPGGFIRLTVEDKGCGMTPQTLARIFDPYFTTKGMGAGTGLGLSVVHGIVKSHGGAITCVSAPGQGSRFDIFLPEIQEKASPVASPAQEITPHGTETILCIDDEIMLSDMTMQMLKGLGYTVVAETDSLAALKRFSENPHHFSAVITDMTMPNLTGDKLARKILDIRPDMPIIICTGYSQYISEEAAAHLGIHSILMKPYSISELGRALRKAIDDSAKNTA